jgi:predicted nucleic acid-binding protein
MYLVGAPHPNKDRARALLESCIERGERLVTDAEVVQEILHRYVSINRRDAIQPACDALLKVADEVYPIELEDVKRAATFLQGLSSLSARDAIHVAIMERYDIERLLSFDRGFDQVGWIERLGET